MSLIKEIKEGEKLPPFYGVAWVGFISNIAVCLPVPFNLIAAILRATWIFLRHGWHGVRNNPRDAFMQGLHEGARRERLFSQQRAWVDAHTIKPENPTPGFRIFCRDCGDPIVLGNLCIFCGGRREYETVRKKIEALRSKNNNGGESER